ncbi:hypothetical protein KEM55_004452 [Ascosphaera atra]|nr:hypothetical protein KEM55_004452 [Ascosphaera atra]
MVVIDIAPEVEALFSKAGLSMTIAGSSPDAQSEPQGSKAESELAEPRHGQGNALKISLAFSKAPGPEKTCDANGDDEPDGKSVVSDTTACTENDVCILTPRSEEDEAASNDVKDEPFTQENKPSTQESKEVSREKNNVFGLRATLKKSASYIKIPPTCSCGAKAKLVTLPRSHAEHDPQFWRCPGSSINHPISFLPRISSYDFIPRCDCKEWAKVEIGWSRFLGSTARGLVARCRAGRCDFRELAGEVEEDYVDWVRKMMPRWEDRLGASA